MARPDQSMSLLTDLQENALEPEYRTAHERGEKRSPGLRAVTAALLAALLVLAGVNTFRTSGEAASERQGLLDQIETTETGLAEMEEEIRQLEGEIQDLSDDQVTDPQLRAQLDLLAPLAGDVAVSGPGIVVRVDDAATAGGEGVVFDSDLTRLVNGLRQAGAEAIAINGRRLTSLTPIRSAGSAITVDYVSLNPPYTVEVIGDPNTLQARFARTSAMVWWKYISDNYGVGFSIRVADEDLQLEADPGMVLRYAEK
ncbi:DUF881 domain-containing protein [Tessaracoccus rhinocerotis]|uniref:DUF881 domain-containing protein n=1 Tax=Tessaracoccus rhinocerotis TaxID=1689449 RepID=A0A553JXR3_9ACTN|nr:DUF881 domain-containing protein [Tessaracoccus rhinocerotis]TRY17241.1 DUF881 domain-containing protein [Tessaracoccus rhinocerotis]